MKEFIERLLAEETELNERKSKLQKFIESEKFNAIEPIQKSLLNIQLQAMNTYSECLNQKFIFINNESQKSDEK